MPISREIKEVRGAFLNFSIVYVGWDASAAAHLYAKQASETGKGVRVSTIPKLPFYYSFQ
jgi:hypothetical protein